MDNEHGNPVPTPFKWMQSRDDFTREIAAVCKKYGYPHFYIAYGIPADEETTDWHNAGNIICDGLIENLNLMIPYLQEQLDEE